MMKPVDVVLHLPGQLEELIEVFGTPETRITAKETLHSDADSDWKLFEINQVDLFGIEFNKSVLERTYLGIFELREPWYYAPWYSPIPPSLT